MIREREKKRHRRRHEGFLFFFHRFSKRNHGRRLDEQLAVGIVRAAEYRLCLWDRLREQGRGGMKQGRTREDSDSVFKLLAAAAATTMKMLESDCEARRLSQKALGRRPHSVVLWALPRPRLARAWSL